MNITYYNGFQIKVIILTTIQQNIGWIDIASELPN